jgi:hypothetical protein
MILPINTTTCIGFTLEAASGEKDFSITGFTALSMILTPESICGSCTISILSGTTFALGKMLSTLSNEIGQRSLTATSPHNRHDIHLGAFLSSSLAAITANISQDAFMVRFRIFKNKALMALTPPS